MLATEASQRAGMKTQNEIRAAEVKEFLDSWGKGLIAISKAKQNGENYTSLAEQMIKNHYDYESGEVLFKPTLASECMFRLSYDGALSYFISGNPKYKEDGGFAIAAWESITFDIAGIHCFSEIAIVMGNKNLKRPTGEKVMANFSMALIRDKKNQLKIRLHHSSLPYVPS